MGIRTWAGRSALAGLLVVGTLVVLPATPAAASPCDAGTRTIFWTGGGRTNTWFDRLNWRDVATGGPGLPGPNDNVCIPNQTPNITVTYDANNATQIKSIEAHEALDISIGSLAVTDTTQLSTLPNLTVDGGGLAGAADVGIGSSLDFSAGTIGGTGTLIVGKNASMTIGGAGAKVLTRDVTVLGALHWTGGDVGTGQGAVFRNGGTFDVNLGANDAFQFNQGGGAPSIVNAGSFTKGGGIGTATFPGAVDNQGTLTLSTSTLSIDSLTNEAGGSLTIGSGTVLDVGGSVNQAGSIVLPGKSTLAAGTIDQTGGTTALQSSSAIVHSGPGAFTLDGGTLDGIGRVDAALVVNGGTVAPGLSPGILQGTGSYTQNGGTLSIEIAGPQPGSGYDRLSLGAAATLGGTLAIDTTGGFSPAVGDSFRVLTAPSVAGSFGSVTGATLPGGAFYDVQSNGGAVSLVVVKPSVSVGNVTVTEGNSGSKPANFPLTLSRKSPVTVSVTVGTANGTATAPSDYTATAKTVTFPPGSTSATVAVQVNGDTTVESNETFSLNIKSATNATVADATGVATITNDDTKPPPTTPPPTTAPPTTAPPTTAPPTSAPPTTAPPTTPPATTPPPPPTTGPPPPPPTTGPSPSPTKARPSPTRSTRPSPSPSGSGTTGAGPTTAPSPSPSASPSPSPPPPVGPTNPDRSEFVSSIDDPDQVPWSAASLLRSGLLALLLLLLILFPSILFNSTLEEHYDEVRGWFRFGRNPDAPSRFAGIRTRWWFKAALFGGFFVAGALLYSFLSPSVGFNKRTLTLFLGLLLGLVLVTLIAELPVIFMLRKVTDRGRIRLLAGSLVVGVVCVAVSRLLHFQPGYLYGVVAGAVFQRELAKDEAGRSVLVASAVLLGSSLLAWLIWVPVSHAANHPGSSIWLLILESVLAAVFVTGIEATVIGLLPIRFLDGHKLWTWNRVLWAIAFVVGAFGMIHLLLRPGSGYFHHSGNTPMFTVMALFAAFGVVSVSFWAYFRYRRPRGEPGASEPTEPAPAAAE